MTIRVLTTLYNSENYIGKTIQSLKLQKEKDWKCYITNDLSTDHSLDVARLNIDEDPRFEIINNKEKFWQTGNYYNIVHKEEISDNDICLTLDGDDFLPDPDVLSRVLNYYKDKDVWMTYGSFMYYNSPENYSNGFAAPPINGIENQRKTTSFTTTHLRTFYTWLFRKIKKETLCEDNGDWLRSAGDLAFMWPMLEMSTDKHSKFIEDINYVYNVETPLNEFKDNYSESERCANICRNRQPHEPLDV